MGEMKTGKHQSPICARDADKNEEWKRNAIKEEHYSGSLNNEV